MADVYSSLWSSNVDTRLQASSKLASTSAEDLSYTLSRLFAGLASPRDYSRLGFSVALTGLLQEKQPSAQEIDQLLSQLLSANQTSASSKGHEERNHLFARLFGLNAFIQAGLATASTSALKTISTELYDLWKTKSWLKESAGHVILDLLSQCVASSLDGWREVIQSVLFEGKEKDWSPEKLAWILLLPSDQDDKSWKLIIKARFSSEDIFSSEARPALAKILRTVDSSSDTSSGRLHFVFPLIFDQIATSSSFQPFYQTCISDNFASLSSSTASKHLLLQILSHLLSFEALPVAAKPALLTPDVQRLLVNHLSETSKGKKMLRGMAQEVIQKLPQLITSAEDAQVAGMQIIKKLLNLENGLEECIPFDTLTKTKTVEGLLANLDSERIAEYIELMKNLLLASAIVEEIEDAEEAELKRKANEKTSRFAVQQLGSLVRRKARGTDQPEWALDVLNFLLTHGFYQSKTSKKAKTPTAILSPAIQALCRERALSVLADLNTAYPKKASHNLSSTIAKFVELDQKKGLDRLQPDSEGIEEGRTSVQTLAESVKTDKPALYLLCLTVLVMSYEDQSGFASLAEALSDVITSLSSTESPITPTVVSDDEGEEAEPTAVLLDFLLVLLRRNAAYLKVVDQIFAEYTSKMGEQAIQLLCEQFAPDEDELVEGEEDDVDMNGKADEDAPASDSESDNESQSSAAGDDGESDGGIDLDADPELRDKVAAALGMAGIAANEEAESDEGEILLDDDQMMALDDQLAAAFKAHSSDRKSAKDAKSADLLSQQRSLDLVEIYLKREYENALVVKIVLALFNVATRSQETDEVELISKANRILKAATTKPRGYPAGVSSEKALSALGTFHSTASRSPDPGTTKICSLCSTFICRSVLPDASTEVVDIYRSSLNDLNTRKNSKVSPVLISDFVSKFPLAAWSLRSDIVNGCGEETVNLYRRLQNVQLLETMASALAAQQTKQSGSELSELSNTASTVIFGLIRSALAAEKTEFTVARLKDLVRFALSIGRATKPSSEDAAATSSWQKAYVQQAATCREQLQSSPVFKAVKPIDELFNQIVVLGQSGKGKRKSKDAKNDQAGTEEPKRKKRKSQ